MARRRTRQNSPPTAAPAPAVSPTTPAPAPALRHTANVFAGPSPLPVDFVQEVSRLEQALGMPVWMVIQNEKGIYGNLDGPVVVGFLKNRDQLQHGQKIALLLDSPGGSARASYKLATFIR